MTRFLRALLLSLCFLFAGCQLTDYTIAKRSAIDAQISAARAETTAQLTALSNKQIGLLNDSVATHVAREQAASNYLFRAMVTFGGLKTPTRAETVMGHSVQQTAAELPPATIASQNETLEALKTELDETKISAAALQVKYDTELTQARADGAAKDKALTDIAASLRQVNDEKVAVLTKAKDTEAQLSDKRKALDDSTIATQAKDLANAKSVQAIKTKMSAIAGGLGLILLLAAIYTPVFREQIGIAAGVFLLTAVVIWYITPLVVGITVGLAALLLVGWMAKNHYIESKSATATYQALQSIKDTAAADYEKVVKPALVAYQTKYAKDGTTIPDPSISAHIDSVLMATGVK